MGQTTYISKFDNSYYHPHFTSNGLFHFEAAEVVIPGASRHKQSLTIRSVFEEDLRREGEEEDVQFMEKFARDSGRKSNKQLTLQQV